MHVLCLLLLCTNMTTTDDYTIDYYTLRTPVYNPHSTRKKYTRKRCDIGRTRQKQRRPDVYFTFEIGPLPCETHVAMSHRFWWNCSIVCKAMSMHVFHRFLTAQWRRLYGKSEHAFASNKGTGRHATLSNRYPLRRPFTHRLAMKTETTH